MGGALKRALQSSMKLACGGHLKWISKNAMLTTEQVKDSTSASLNMEQNGSSVHHIGTNGVLFRGTVILEIYFKY